MSRGPVSALLLFVSGAGSAEAQIAPPVPPAAKVIVATSPVLAPTIRRLADAFGAGHPHDPHPQVIATGSDVAMAYLATGKAHAAIIGREATDPEIKAFQWVFNRPPQDLPVMRGCIGGAGCSADLVVLAHPSNPIRSISITEIEKVLAPASQRTQAHLPDVESGTGRFIRARLARSQVQFDWGRVHEHEGNAAAAAIAKSVAGDRTSLGVASNGLFRRVRVLPVEVDGKVARPGDDDYPLSRTVHVLLDFGQSDAAAFVEFIRTPEGQAIVAAGPYRPLRR